MDGLLQDFPALTHVVVTGNLDSNTDKNMPPTRRPLRSAPAGRRPVVAIEPVALTNTLPQSIHSLDLSRALLIDVSALARLPNLTELKLPKLHAQADQALAANTLAQLTQLTELSLWQPAMQDFAFLRDMKGLRSLTIAGTWSVLDLELLRGLSRLSNLELKLCHVANVGALAGTSTASLPLETLTLTGVAVLDRPSNVSGPVTQDEMLAGLNDTGAGFDNVLTTVSRCNQVTTLNIGGMVPDDLSSLRYIRSLTALSLRMTDESDWASLLELPNLTSLDQQGDCDSPTVQWDILVELPALHVLRNPVYLDEEDPPLPLVETLVVYSTNDMMAQKLRNWPQLTSINWRGQCDTDLVRQLPSNLRDLELDLDLDHDIEFKRLKRLTRLESLRVHCTRLRFLYRRQGSREEVQEEGYSFLSALTALEKLGTVPEPGPVAAAAKAPVPGRCGDTRG